MAKGALGTAGTAGPFADGESQPARCDAGRVMVCDHQPCRLGSDRFAARPEELTQEDGDVRRGGVRPAPGGAEVPPIGAVPVPVLGLWVAAPRLGRGALLLARDHLF